MKGAQGRYLIHLSIVVALTNPPRVSRQNGFSSLQLHIVDPIVVDHIGRLEQIVAGPTGGQPAIDSQRV